MEIAMTPIAPVPVAAESIRRHYDRCGALYRRLWGRHLHHGLWDGDHSAERAQLRLIERLAEAAALPRQAAVLDAGCGLGGSSVWLAERGHRVTGVTLSGVQAAAAARLARENRTDHRVEILRADLEQISFPDGRFDAVWSVECTEHLADKPAFFAKAGRWLRPGGTLAICAWTRAEDLSSPARAAQIRDICRGFLCPSLGAVSDYIAWFRRAGARLAVYQDLSESAARTWDVCLERVRPLWVSLAARLLGDEARRFRRSFSVMRDAFRSGALRYSLFVARKEPA